MDLLDPDFLRELDNLPPGTRDRFVKVLMHEGENSAFGGVVFVLRVVLMLMSRTPENIIRMSADISERCQTVRDLIHVSRRDIQDMSQGANSIRDASERLRKSLEQCHKEFNSQRIAAAASAVIRETVANDMRPIIQETDALLGRLRYTTEESIRVQNEIIENVPRGMWRTAAIFGGIIGLALGIAGFCGSHLYLSKHYEQEFAKRVERTIPAAGANSDVVARLTAAGVGLNVFFAEIKGTTDSLVVLEVPNADSHRFHEFQKLHQLGFLVKKTREQLTIETERLRYRKDVSDHQ